jgi:chromosome segregation ATPase
MIRTLQEKHEYDKTALRSEYETLIGTIREEYNTQKGELREHMKKLELELSFHEKDFRQIRAKFDEQIAAQAEEIQQQKDAIQQQNMQIIDLTQKKNLAESDNMRLQQELGSLSQENDLVKM